MDSLRLTRAYVLPGNMHPIEAAVSAATVFVFVVYISNGVQQVAFINTLHIYVCAHPARRRGRRVHVLLVLLVVHICRIIITYVSPTVMA